MMHRSFFEGVKKPGPEEEKTNSHGFLVAAVTVAIVLIFMKTLPIFASLSIPSALRNNGALVTMGLIVFVFIATRGRCTEQYAYRAYLPFVAYACLSTMLMSLVLFEPLGVLYGEDTISASLPSYAWLIAMALSLMAFDYLFNTIGPKGLDAVLEAFTVVVIVVGCIQALSVLGLPLYGLINRAGLFQEIIKDRISTIGMEPSTNGGIICMLALPFVVSKIGLGASFRFRVYAALLVALIFFVSSSQCYIAFFALLVGCLFLYARPKVRRSSVVLACLVGVFICCAILVLMVSGGDLLKSEPVQKLNYYLFEKVSDKSNASTINRTSTLINDLIVFSHFPLFGCGDGIQGFFFNENVSNHAITSGSQELANLMAGKSGVVGPGCFITAILSSFGIVGFILFTRGLVRTLAEARRCRRGMAGYYEMTLLSLAAALPMGFIGISFNGSWQFYVILAIPFLASSVLRREGAKK